MYKGNIVRLFELDDFNFRTKTNPFINEDLKIIDETLFGEYDSTSRDEKIKEMMLLYYDLDSITNEDTFAKRFSRIWNSNILDLTSRMLSYGKVKDLLKDYKIISKTTSSEQTTDESNKNIIKNTTDIITNERTDEGSNSGLQRTANNPNTTIADNILDEYTTSAEGLEASFDSKINDNNSKVSDSTDNEIQEGTSIKEGETLVEGSGVDLAISIINAIPNINELTNSFMEKFRILFIINYV